MAKTSRQRLEGEFQQHIHFDCTVVPNLLLRHYGNLGLTDRECIQLLGIWGAIPKGKKYFTYNNLRDFWQEDAQDLQIMMTDFIKRKFLTKTDSKTIEDGYTLDGLFEKLFELWVYLQACPKENSNSATDKQPAKTGIEYKNLIKQVYAMFEGEFGRPLSPTEIEAINKWLVEDNWKGEMIKEALKRAVLHGTCNLIYVDKILTSWQKQGIFEMAQLQAAESKTGSKAQKNTQNISTKQAKSKIMENTTDYSNIYKF